MQPSSLPLLHALFLFFLPLNSTPRYSGALSNFPKSCLISVTLCKLNWLPKYDVCPRQIKLIAFNREQQQWRQHRRSFLRVAMEIITIPPAAASKINKSNKFPFITSRRMTA